VCQPKGRQVKAAQVVSVGNEKGLVPELAPMGQKCGASAKQDGLLAQADMGFPRRCVQIVLDSSGMVMGIDIDGTEMSPNEQFQPNIQQRPTVDGNEAFGNGLGQGAKARAKAGRQQEGWNGGVRSLCTGHVGGFLELQVWLLANSKAPGYFCTDQAALPS